MSAIKKVGRPTIANSEVPAHIFEGLLHKSRGRTWADSATAVGLRKYQTLKEWVNKNEEAKKFYKEAVQERLTCAVPPVAERFVGTEGWLGATGVALTVSELALLPAAL